MKSLILALLIFAFMPSGFAGPILVGSGAGSAEYSVVFANANLQEMLKYCRDGSCGFDANELRLNESLITLAAVAPKPVFKNEKDMTAELYRLSASNVWINQDRLWLDAAGTIPYTIGNAVALWVDILGRPYLPAADLEIMKRKVSESFDRQFVRGKVEIASAQTFEYLLWKRDCGDLLVMRDAGLQTVALLEPIAKQLGCKDTSSIQIFSPSWVPGPGAVTNEAVMTLNFGLKWACGSSRGNTTARAIVTTRYNSANVLSFDPASLFIHID